MNGLNIDHTPLILKTAWPAIRDSVLKGIYRHYEKNAPETIDHCRKLMRSNFCCDMPMARDLLKSLFDNSEMPKLMLFLASTELEKQALKSAR